MTNSDNIKIYLNQDIDNPKYLFHGSTKKLKKIVPMQSTDSYANQNNIANAVFLFPSFIKSVPYAFKDTIKVDSKDLPWNFEIPNSNSFPLMVMENVNIDENIVGYIYVFEKEDTMIKDEKSYQYKCYEELVPCDIIEVCYKDYAQYFEVKNNCLNNKKEGDINE